MQRFKIPYLNTSMETDLAVTLFLSPLWWISGFSIFAYHAAVLIAFFKLLMASIVADRPLKVPLAAQWFCLYLTAYLLSVLMNIPLRPAGRILASLNNYSLLVMGFLLLIVIYNSRPELCMENFIRVCRLLCIISGIIGIFFLMVWLRGDKNPEAMTWLAKKFPSLLHYPYFYNTLLLTGVMTDWVANSEFPRLALYSSMATSTGGLMLALMPMMMAYYSLKKNLKWEYLFVLILSTGVVFFSLSRTVIYAFLVAFMTVHLIENGKKWFTALGALLAAFFLSGYFYRVFEWALNIRQSSNIGRLELYEQAFKIVMAENPLMGIGVRLREEFTLMAVGTHSFYIETLLVTGFVGLFLFIVFQFLVLFNWYRQRNFLKNPTEKILWKYLGISLIALNLWLTTDSLAALPFVSFLYFWVAGEVLVLGRMTRQ